MGKRFNTDREFKLAVEERINKKISRTTWVLLADFLLIDGIHDPFTDADIDYLLYEFVPKLQKIIEVLKEKENGR